MRPVRRGMEHRTLGKTGLKVSSIGFGAWGIGGAMWGPVDDEKSREAVRAALKLGVNFFDTAWVYGDGHSERLLGEELPDDAVVATKVPPMDWQWPAGNPDPEKVFPKRHVLSYAKKSHENLQRDIDLLQLHVWHDQWLEGSWSEAFAELRDAGIVRHFGISVNDHQPESAVRLAESGKIDALQVIYNIFDQSPVDRLLAAAKKHGVGILARCPFDEGSLTGVFSERTRFSDWRRNYFTPERMPEVVKKVEALRWLERPGRSLAQASLQFCLAHPAVSTVIPGMRTASHVSENVAAAKGSLSKEELSKLARHRWERNFYR